LGAGRTRVPLHAGGGVPAGRRTCVTGERAFGRVSVHRSPQEIRGRVAPSSYGDGMTSTTRRQPRQGDAVDREKALDMALSQIERQFGKGAVMRMGDHAAQKVAAIPTGALSLDLALGVGGLPRGRVVEIYGPESS